MKFPWRRISLVKLMPLQTLDNQMRRLIENIPDPVETIRFYADNISASQTDSGMSLSGTQKEFMLLKPGYIEAIGVRLSEARTAGQVEFNVKLSGTEIVDSVIIDGTNTQSLITQVEMDLDSIFEAGDYLEAQYTSDASWTPTTADAGLFILVRYVDQ